MRRGTWRDVVYKGDRMRRPIASNEVAWLVRLLLAASDAVNARLGLSVALADGEAAPRPDAPALQARDQACMGCQLCACLAGEGAPGDFPCHGHAAGAPRPAAGGRRGSAAPGAPALQVRGHACRQARTGGPVLQPRNAECAAGCGVAVLLLSQALARAARPV